MTASELFPFLSNSTPNSTQALGTGVSAAVNYQANIGKQQQQQHTIIQCIPLLAQDTKGGKILYRQVCAQPQHEKCHPYQLRAKQEYPELVRQNNVQVAALLEEKQQADRCRERQYRQLLFGVASI